MTVVIETILGGALFLSCALPILFILTDVADIMQEDM